MRNLEPIISALKTFSFIDLLDVMVVACFTFWILKIVHGLRAERLFKGVVALIVVYGISLGINLIAVSFILRQFFAIGAIVLVMVFQPELRRILEHFGRGKFGYWGRFFSRDEETDPAVQKAVDILVGACETMSRNKVGALIVIGCNDQLEDIASTGVILDAKITQELLINIFFENAPLHDGAVIILSDRVYAAACILPLSNKPDIDKKYGTRHRAAIGMSENSDAVVLVVSEERGDMSLAHKGKIKLVKEADKLKKDIIEILIPRHETNRNYIGLKPWGNKLKTFLSWVRGKVHR